MLIVSVYEIEMLSIVILPYYMYVRYTFVYMVDSMMELFKISVCVMNPIESSLWLLIYYVF